MSIEWIGGGLERQEFWGDSFARNSAENAVATFATGWIVPSDGPADIARPYVRRRGFRALITHRGSSERPRGDSPRPSVESDRDTLNRCVVVQDAVSDGAGIDGILRDANDRRWPAGPAPALPARHRSANRRTTRQQRNYREHAHYRETTNSRKSSIFLRRIGVGCGRSIVVSRKSRVKRTRRLFSPP